MCDCAEHTGRTVGQGVTRHPHPAKTRRQECGLISRHWVSSAPGPDIETLELKLIEIIMRRDVAWTIKLRVKIWVVTVLSPASTLRCPVVWGLASLGNFLLEHTDQAGEL